MSDIGRLISYRLFPAPNYRYYKIHYRSTSTRNALRLVLDGGGLELVSTLEPVLCVSTATELVLCQENWFWSGNNTLLVSNKEPLTSGSGGHRDHGATKNTYDLHF